MVITWKRAFFLLLSVILIILLFVLILMYQPVEEEFPPSSRESSGEFVQFQVQSNKGDLNKLINHYIEKEAKGPIDYRVVLQDEVELYGIVKVFTQELEMKLTFEPEALLNGDLVLKQKSIFIGRLELPVSYVLKFIRDQYQLPEWVEIQPAEKLIYLSVDKLKLKSDIKVKIRKFDLRNDDIKFTLLVPTK